MMSLRFSVQSPYVLASLPRPINFSTGRYVVGDVYGQVQGTKKRKRAELAVGVDGEGVSLFNVSSSRLITSYALPPDTSFTCPPSSLRIRVSKSKVERRTYVSTTGLKAQITLFHDSAEGPGATQSSTATRQVDISQKPIVFMETISATRGSDVGTNASDLLVIKEDGEIQCLDGNSLQERWTSPAAALGQESTTTFTDAKVEFAHLTNACAASQGILKGRQDVFAHFPQEIAPNGFNPDILIIITKSTSEGTIPTRTVHIFTLPILSSGTQLNGLRHSVKSLLVANLPLESSTHAFESNPAFSIHVTAGILHQLCGDVLTTFDLSDTLPKIQSQIFSTGAQSFIRLSSASIMISSADSISVYNPKFQSILATVPLKVAPNGGSMRLQKGIVGVKEGAVTQSCNFVAYFPKLATAVAIAANDLVAIHIESQQNRQGKSRATGLLIDSIGCPVHDELRPWRAQTESATIDLTTMKSYLRGSIGSSEKPWSEQTRALEQSVAAGNAIAFDTSMAKKLGLDWAKNEQEVLVNGSSKRLLHERNGPGSGITNTQTVQIPDDVDRRWVLYALSKIFTWSKKDSDEFRLSVRFYPPNVFMWLIKTGSMSVANVESALRNELRASFVESIPGGNLVNALIELDPDMDLLLGLLSKNFLGAAELLQSIRQLMESLGLFGEDGNTEQGLLTNGDVPESIDVDVEEEFKKLETEAEADLELAEYQLGPGSGVRGQALSLAFTKLYACPTNTIVHGLQTTFTNQEIVSLIYLLRFEMARGAWTSRYLDVDQSKLVDDDFETPENTIILISSLLNNCIDAVGAGGWLSGEARLVNGDPFQAEELIASLKLEVSAALEGIEEATYLKGLTSEMVRYSDAVQRGAPRETNFLPDGVTLKKRKTLNPPIKVPFTDQDNKILPLGLKADQHISRLRVGAGGEVHKRSSRDIGRLKSQKVGKYSLERITI